MASHPCNDPVPREVDLRDLLAPEPLLQALALADALPPGGSVVVLTPLWPHPLLAVLDERGLHHHAEALSDEGVRVRIERPRDGSTGA